MANSRKNPNVEKWKKQEGRDRGVVVVRNLSTGTEHTYQGITARQAVVAAYAQSLKDYNTWDYEKKYDHLVKMSANNVLIGDFTAWR